MAVTKTSKTASDAAQPAAAFQLTMVDEGDGSLAPAHHILDANGNLTTPLKNGDAVAVSSSALPTGAATASNQALQLAQETAAAAALGAPADAAWTSGPGSAIALLKKIASNAGGGGAVTVADGADVAQGSTADTAWTSGPGSIIGLLKAAVGALKGTISVSGTFYQATQPVSASSLPLPTGAATSAKQPAIGVAGTASTDVLTVQGIASATPLPVSGTFWQTTQPVSGTFWQATQPVSLSALPALVAGSAIVGKVGIDQTTPGTTNLVQVGGSLPLPAAITPVVSTALETSHILKASAGSVKSVTMALSPSGAAGWLLLVNSATVPSAGPVTPLAAAPVDAGGIASISYDAPAGFNAGIVALYSVATTPFTYTAGGSFAFFSGQVI